MGPDQERFLDTLRVPRLVPFSVLGRERKEHIPAVHAELDPPDLDLETGGYPASGAMKAAAPPPG